MMKTINLELTIEETNLVLAALADRPFRESAGLIAKIREQAEPQVQDAKPIETVTKIEN